MQKTGRRILAVFASIWAGAVGAAEVAVNATGPVVELPKFEVTDSRLLPPPESWRYAELPGFEILSNVSERGTKRFVHDFLLLQEVIDATMPGLIRHEVAVPTAVILCGRGNGFDEFLPTDRADERFSTNSLFFINSERAAIVIDFALSELQLDNDTSQEADPYRAFYAAYFRFLMRNQLGKPPPAWFEEGIVQILAAVEFDRKSIRFAQIGDGFGGSKSGDFTQLLLEHSLLSFPELFADPPARRDAYWSAQSYAFVHLGLYGMERKYQKGFIQFVDRLSREPLTEQMFKECFNRSFADMGIELRSYLGFTVHTTTQFTAKKGKELPEPPPVTLRAATQAEVGRLKGEVLRLGGHDVAAHTALIAPYVRGEREPRLLAALGLDERISRHDDRALKFLDAAIAAQVVRPRAYLELARLRAEAAGARPAGAGGKLDETQVRTIVQPLTTARTQRPPMPEVYALLAATWTQADRPVTRENFETVLEGVRLFPRDVELLWQATLLGAAGKFPEARALALRGVKLATAPADQDKFATLGAALQRDAAPTASPSTIAPAPAPITIPAPFTK